MDLSRKIVCLIFICGLMVQATRAQDGRRNEVGLLLGVAVTPSLASGGGPADIEFGKGHTFQATYARHLINRAATQLSFEVPLLAAPSIDVRSIGISVPSEYASLFITPGFRMKVAPQAPLSPWVAAGGGYARFREADQRQDGAPNVGRIGRNTGALQFSGGVDIRTPLRILFPISLRLEVRDVYSGKPTYNALTGGSSQHNVVISGGFVVHF